MKGNTAVDHVTINLDQKLNRLSLTHPDCFIYHVYDRIRHQNPKAYEPEMVAIGPYHHSKSNVQSIQEHKLRYLRLLLKRRNEPTVHRYITAMRALEERARSCYSDSGSLSGDKFVEMMLLDSCFISELLRKFTITYLRDPHDMLFKMDWIHQSIWRDIMLFENQLPFFVLEQFFNMTRSSDPRDSLALLGIRYYCYVRQYYVRSRSPFPDVFQKASSVIPTHDAKHFLGLIHSITSSSFLNMLPPESKIKKRWEFIQCATELHESGIKFRKARHDTSLFDIRFVDGTLIIPPFSVEEKVESLLRNLIAYEQLLPETNRKCVSDYVTFLFCLVNSGKDVSLLRRYGILGNMLGDDEAASVVLSKASTSVFVSREGFCYAEVFNSINAHCRRRQNIWTATLKRKYFNSPWKIISFLGAMVLLILTFAQTVLAVLSYIFRNC